ncbi:M23 family metallopeptidase [Galbibacter pacificus]|uniref:M23 family metallopeptidase n=1 Tax=Galbibacter pacificus TaxID=2996052 RepID=A0ABT6FN30_9FLAO|nr:M23 family metallopeptidase [Galbibacter pacificus]MDG3581195.1 M23 family metallopeptidase [Galbibacter pacificus]MDG3584673.1 M23 family metallopeptidase [Galbibacter pacificus]
MMFSLFLSKTYIRILNKRSLKINLSLINIATLISLLLTGSLTFGQSYRETLDIKLPDTINLIGINGNKIAYYELYLTNFSTDTFTIKEIRITNGRDGSILLSLQKNSLKNNYIRIGTSKKDSDMQLPPGNTAVVYIDLDTQKKQPENIAHQIIFEAIHKNKASQISVHTSPIKCISNNQLVLGAPLKGGYWTTVYEPSWERGHRRVIYTLNGKARIPGRYAIDFIKVDKNGTYATGDENIVANWLGYRADVFAVADGIVSAVGSDFLESPTISDHPRHSADQATGNYISIKIGDSQFAFYEHLRPGSIKVKVGQKIKKGELIASLGFTGQTTGPHLHFHVADTNSPLGAEGIPFVFEKFQFLGAYEDFGKFGKMPWTPIHDLTQSDRKEERPKPNAVIKFK